MTLRLRNTTAEDVIITDYRSLTIPASDSILIDAQTTHALRLSLDLYDFLIRGVLVLNNGSRDFPQQLGIAVIYNNFEHSIPLADFTTEVAAGNVPNYESSVMVFYSNSVNSSSLTDIWMATGNMVQPTGNETYEILSSSTADTPAGTGARTVLVNSLDADGYEQQTVVNLNGTTPVTLANTNSYPRDMTVISSGSGQTNAGNLTLRVQGAGATRSYMLAGKGLTLNCHFQIPAGKIFYPTSLDFHTGGAAKPVTIESQISTPGSNTWISTSIIPFIETSFFSPFRATLGFPPGTRVRYRARLDTGSDGSVAAIISGFYKSII